MQSSAQFQEDSKHGSLFPTSMPVNTGDAGRRPLNERRRKRQSSRLAVPISFAVCAAVAGMFGAAIVLTDSPQFARTTARFQDVVQIESTLTLPTATKLIDLEPVIIMPSAERMAAVVRDRAAAAKAQAAAAKAQAAAAPATPVKAPRAE